MRYHYERVGKWLHSWDVVRFERCYGIWHLWSLMECERLGALLELDLFAPNEEATYHQTVQEYRGRWIRLWEQESLYVQRIPKLLVILLDVSEGTSTDRTTHLRRILSSSSIRLQLQMYFQVLVTEQMILSKPPPSSFVPGPVRADVHKATLLVGGEMRGKLRTWSL